MFSGQRMMTSYIRIGGLALEPPRGWQQVVGKFITGVSEQGGRVRGTAGHQSHLDAPHARASGFAPLEDLLDLGVTGPMIRAAGVKWDIRKDEPYSSYDKFDFEIPDANRKRRICPLPRAPGRNAAKRAHH